MGSDANGKGFYWGDEDVLKLTMVMNSCTTF